MDWFYKMNKKEFDFDNKKFERYIKGHSYFMKRKSISIKKLLKKYKKGVGLDLGCGSGEMEQLIWKNFKEIVAIDPSPNQIKKAKEKKLPNCQFKICDGLQPNLPKNYFDFIIVVNVLHHIHSKKERSLVIENCYNLLKKNGILLIYEHNPLNPLVWFKFNYFSEIDRGCKMVDPYWLKKISKRRGFKLNKISYLFSEALGEYALISKKPHY